MSGGHFNYEQYKFQQIADEIEQLVINNGRLDKNQWGDIIGGSYTAETIEEFRRGMEVLNKPMCMLNALISWCRATMGKIVFTID